MKVENISAVKDLSTWICCQLGARDHYSIPRGLHQRGLLAGLITETWIPPTSALARIPGALGDRLRSRYDNALADANVIHSSSSMIGYEVYANLTKSRNIWDPIIARNNWFQAKAIRHLRSLIRRDDSRSRQIIFAYSYAAQKILRTARDLGCTTVLGQIDPGPLEERIVADIYSRRGNKIASNQRVPESYWEAWREECDLSHHIVVNSVWTRNALIAEGVTSEKIHVVPVAYDPPDESDLFERTYPNSFNAVRPLHVLFLGSLIPRKGIHEMLDATILLRTAPVQFRFVGASGSELGVKLAGNPQVHWMGSVPRQKVQGFYRNADVFILPTHSDGFGLTQLEAMAAGLPVIASRNCGEVVKQGVNGLILPAVTAEAIAESLEWCIKNPGHLRQMSDCAARTSNEFRANHLVSRLLRSLKACHEPLSHVVRGGLGMSPPA